MTTQRQTGASNSTTKRVAELRKKIDLSDIPEIKDFSSGHLRNWKPAKKPVSFLQKSGQNIFVNL